MTESFIIRPVHDILLHGSLDVPIGLFQLHTATAEQLCRLHYRPGCIKAVKARLKDLADHGYVQHDVIPSKEFRKPYYYTLAAKGARYLQQAGLDTNDAFRASKEVNKHRLFVEHALELNDVVIAATLLKATGTGYYLYNFIHERTLRRRPYKASWRVSERVLERGRDNLAWQQETDLFKDSGNRPGHHHCATLSMKHTAAGMIFSLPRKKPGCFRLNKKDRCCTIEILPFASQFK